MEPRRLLTFRAVARQRSFSAAAGELSLSQPSVSQQVAALERELGTQLLDRRPGGLRLTPAGSVLLEHADAIAERLELAETQLAEIAGAERSTLVLGAFPTALAALVPAAIGALATSPASSSRRARRRRSPSACGRAPAPGGHVPGRRAAAARAGGARAPRPAARGLPRRAAAGPSARRARRGGHLRARRRAVDGAVGRRHRRARLPRRGLRAAAVLDHARPARDPRARRARARGRARARAARRRVRGPAAAALAGRAPERDVYVLLPPGGRHPLVGDAVAALTAAADELRLSAASA